MMNTLKRHLAAASMAMAGLVLAGGATDARQEERQRALDEQIGRIYQAREYEVPRFGPARWLADGTAYTTLEDSAGGGSKDPPDAPGTGGSKEPPDGRDIVRYDARTGERRIIVEASRLKPPGAAFALSIDDYQWSEDGRRLLVFTNTARVWRQNTRGDYWVLDLDTGALTQLGKGSPPSTLMFAKFSPDGKEVAYVRANDIYVERIEDGRITRLTNDGSETTINGTSDWVYEEELAVRDGFRWSPDGTHIAYWQFDTSGVGVFSLINDTDALYPVITRIPYPKVGTTNSSVRIGVVGVADQKTLWMKTPGDPRDDYLARLHWLDERTLALQQLNRLQNRQDLLLADAANGDVRRVFRDESDTWVDVGDEVTWIDDERSFLWLSERDGWRHLYRVPRDGGEGRLLTRFDADVIDLAGVDEDGGWAYLIASPANAGQRYLYRARLDGTGVPERVTPDEPGTHGYDMAPGARLAFHTYSRFDAPPRTDVVDLEGHRSLRSLTDTSALVATLHPLVKPPVEFFTLDIGEGVTLDGWMLKPTHFDAAKRYPLIMHVYGEPAGQTVLDRWGGSTMLFHRALAEAGYVIASVDNRGTPAPKGAAWRKVVYGTVGDHSSRDQAAAVRALVARHPFLDGSRVGVWGASGGGSNTLNAMFRFPDLFHVGVALAPVPDQTLYDTIYQERYMGLPKDNAAGYRLGSPIHFAEGLRGRLLIVHGSGDDNVHYQGTEKLVNRLVELGKPFDMMVYPNRTHALSEGPGTPVHLRRLMARYFLTHLPPAGE